MSLAAVTAKIRGVALHLARADTSGIFCGRRVTDNTLFTRRPEEVTCKRCLTRYREHQNQNQE